MPKLRKSVTAYSSGDKATGSSGVDVTATKDGLRVGGWYDSMVGIYASDDSDGCFLLTWDRVDEMRKMVGG